MKLRLLLIFLVIGFSIGIAQKEYPLVSIHDIQYIDSVGTKGWSKSKLEKDTVRVRGVVMIRTLVDPDTNRNPIMSYSGAWSTYIQDTSAQARQDGWGGMNIYQSDSTKQGTNLDLADTADYVEITGIVTTYGQTTEFAPLVSPVTSINFISKLSKRPDPIQLSVTDFMNNIQPVKDAFKYSGMYVEVHNLTSGNRNTTTGEFYAYDSNGNYLDIYPTSRYYRLNYKLPFSKYQVPADGTYISSIRGIVSVYNNVFEILPIYPEDIVIETVPPTFSDISRSPLKAGTNQPDTVSIKVEGHTGHVTNVQVHYRIGNADRVISDMTQTLNDPTIYYAVIPGISKDSTVVDYFFTAVDDSNLTSFTPTDTVKGNYFYQVLDEPLTIRDVQYSPFGSGYSAYNGYEVTVRGIVTADTSDIDGNETGTASSPAVYIQNGTGPWSGIRIFGTETLNRKRGDDVTVTGIVYENFGVTQIGAIGSEATVTVNATGQPVPEAQLLSTADIDDLPGGSVEAEKWEGVLVKVANVTVTDENADGDPGPDQGSGGNRNYGDILVADTSNKDLRIDLQDGGGHQYHNYWLPYLENQPIRVYQGSRFESITGICWFAFSHYKLIPRTNEDFTGFIAGVKSELNNPNRFELSQNYPNPFNPSTTINYSIPKESMVQLKIFNILGQQVKTLVSENEASGIYTVRFDASNLSSGIYFYSLRAGNYYQVKKMLLLK